MEGLGIVSLSQAICISRISSKFFSLEISPSRPQRVSARAQLPRHFIGQTPIRLVLNRSGFTTSNVEILIAKSMPKRLARRNQTARPDSQNLNPELQSKLIDRQLLFRLGEIGSS